MPGSVVSGQVAEAFAVAPAVEQASLPVAVTVLSTEHVSAGVVKVAAKLVDAPGARLGTVNTVPGVDRLLETTTLFRVTLPVLRTVPVKVIGPPAAASTVGQTRVTEMPEAVVVGQVTSLVLETGVRVH